MLLLTACASVEVENRQRYEGPRLDRPEHVWVHPFAATPGDLPTWSDAAERYANVASSDASSDQIDLERQLGHAVADELIARIASTGLRAARADETQPPQPGDLIFVGLFKTVEEGNAGERIALGFGSGAAEVTVEVEGYLATTAAPRKLGSGTATSEPGRSPGMVVPAAVAIATKNPIGLVVGGAVKATGEISGRTTVEGVGRSVADEIAEVLEARFREEGWID